jgi:hypothetical protein
VRPSRRDIETDAEELAGKLASLKRQILGWAEEVEHERNWLRGYVEFTASHKGLPTTIERLHDLARRLREAAK